MPYHVYASLITNTYNEKPFRVGTFTDFDLAKVLVEEIQDEYIQAWFSVDNSDLNELLKKAMNTTVTQVEAKVFWLENWFNFLFGWMH
jgi:hypothetical protein